MHKSTNVPSPARRRQASRLHIRIGKTTLMMSCQSTALVDAWLSRVDERFIAWTEGASDLASNGQ